MILAEQQNRAGRPADELAQAGRPLAERAATAARAELRGERTGILGALASSAPPLPLARMQRVPERWSLVHVMESPFSWWAARQLLGGR